MISITLDPATDTPEALKKFAEDYQVKPGWYFLTGKYEEIERLRRKLGAYHPNPKLDADKSRHAGLVVYGDEPTGRWRAVRRANPPPELITDAVLQLTVK